MRNDKNALTVFLFGLGTLALVVGLCTDLYSAPIGVVGWIGAWVVAATLRTFYGTGDKTDEDYYEEYRRRI
jgi:hypothetical protein